MTVAPLGPDWRWGASLGDGPDRGKTASDPHARDGLSTCQVPAAFRTERRTACPGPSCDAGLDAGAGSFLEFPWRVLTRGQGSEMQTSIRLGGTVPLLTAVTTVRVTGDSALMPAVSSRCRNQNVLSPQPG